MKIKLNLNKVKKLIKFWNIKKIKIKKQNKIKKINKLFYNIYLNFLIFKNSNILFKLDILVQFLNRLCKDLKYLHDKSLNKKTYYKNF